MLSGENIEIILIKNLLLLDFINIDAFDKSNPTWDTTNSQNKMGKRNLPYREKKRAYMINKFNSPLFLKPQILVLTLT